MVDEKIKSAMEWREGKRLMFEGKKISAYSDDARELQKFQ